MWFDAGPDDDLLRGELFSLDQLEEHARALAGTHRVQRRAHGDQILIRLGENEAALTKGYRAVVAAANRGRRVPPAAEWFLDHFYLVEEQIRTARRHLPRGYSRELPRLIGGAYDGYPRVYVIALELISHIDGRVDAESVSKFVSAYQATVTLTLGELWAIPIMLRLALIENLRRIGQHLARSLHQRQQAGQWADRLIALADNAPSDLVLVVAEMATASRRQAVLRPSFVAEFTRRLQGLNPALVVAITWLEQRLDETNTTVEQVVQGENQTQAIDQVSIGNSITSLRSLSNIDWRGFVESLSVVDRTLRAEPAGVYARMDFATRDAYRHVIEDIAKRSHLSEPQVAEQAVTLVRTHHATDHAAREAHVGHVLIDHGRTALELAAAATVSPWRRLGETLKRWPLTAYLGGAALLGVLTWVVAFTWIGLDDLGPINSLAVAVLVGLVASQWALTCVNWLVTTLLTPRTLPRLDFSDGIPAQHRTMVVIPTLLRRASDVEHLLEGLEVRYLANPDAHLDFALLTDFGDAAKETLPEDEALLKLAIDGIEELNRRYAEQRAHAFFLFHRPRRWNAQERTWMGWERKRGKIEDLNALLLHGERSRFSTVVGEISVFAQIRYVITLDTDTQLPRDAARELVGTLAHPLNRPRFTSDGRITDGYAILQPRAAISLPSASRSWFARIFSGEPGIDPYSRAVSDVYQDLFHEGSFVGKGIYDLVAFHRALSTRFPENRVLSHDLIEGSFARAALVSDVMVFEDHPARYTADVTRRHRWTRGDWQLAPWLMPRVRDASGKRITNTLSRLARWKLADNLRRSLVAPATLLLLIGGWTVLPGGGAFWVLLVLAFTFSPLLLTTLVNLARKVSDVPWGMHLKNQADSFGVQVAQAALGLVFLPYEAVTTLDAIIRTLGRLLMTRRRLLEWQTASDAERTAKTTIAGLAGTMWSAPAVALTTAALTIACAPGDLHDALPLLTLWFCSPVLAWLISQPVRTAAHNLQPRQVQFLGRAARKTWRFFETFVGADDHWLPPDNYQEYPASVIAHRTSPTNLGLALLANVAAHDLGYIPLPRLLERTGQTLGTMSGMERHRGHFYNWYDTRTAKAIPPFYISMVDSGNLAGHLLTLRSGLGELADQPILHATMFSGLNQTLLLLVETATAAGSKAGGGWSTRLGEFAKLWSDLERDLRSPPRTVNAALALLNRLIAVAGDFVTNVATASDDELRWWAGALEQGCRDHRDHLLHIAPWSQLPPAPDVLWRLESEQAGKPQHLTALRINLARLDQPLTLTDIAGFAQGLSPQLDFFLDEYGQHQDSAVRAAVTWISALRTPVHQASERANQLIERSAELATTAGGLADMEWGFLYDRSRELFAIGYNVAEHRLDGSFYDLLASEARLGSFIAIAQGQVSQDHWFALGRLLTASHSAPALLSWAGSMFEYLMPMLVMPSHAGTLLDQTCRAVIRRQIDYGRQRGVPWGISESGYNLTDGALNYQYRAFGVPGLGLKRGLSDDLVIAPYASAMALMVDPEAACTNLQRIAAAGHEGPYGFYEAIDFTPARVPRGATAATVRSFMVHHQGMALLGLLYVLADRPMQRRFTNDPLIKSTELLLQERVPKSVPVVYPHAAEAGTTRKVAATPEATARVFTNPGMAVPEVHLLSNGRYQVLVTSAGGGYSRWKDLAVNRWREDVTRDAHGMFCYLRDIERGDVWSTTWQPTLAQPTRYEAVFTQGRAEFKRSDHEIDAYTEVAVSPEDDIELRRTTLTNRSRTVRVIEITTYAECVLAPATAEIAHPAFSNLFVQTQLVGDAILCTRRPRKATDPKPWLVHLMRVHGNEIGKPSFETARAGFIGRSRSPGDPLAMRQAGALSGTTGPVLDPIVAIRRTINLQPDESAVIDVVLGVAEAEGEARELAAKYRDRRLTDRVFGLSWTHSQVVLGQLGASEADAQVYGRLTSSVVFANPQRRASATLLASNRQGQSGLWSYGISGDLPIVLLKITDAAKMDLVRQLVNAHAYWRLKGLAVDLVIWNEDHSVYRQAINDEIVGLVASGPEAAWLDKPGGIFVRRADQMSEEDRVLLQTVARAVISDNAGTLAQFVERRARPELPLPRLVPARNQRTEQLPTPPQPTRDLLFANGLGGFSQDGSEYVIVLAAGQTTPAPWVNVMANAGFGTVVSESGSAYTWTENSHEFRLTPWHNDAVTDDGGEALYLRDEESGRFWSPTPWPARAGAYTIRHGFGYSVFSHQHAGLSTELTVFVATDAPVKLARLRIRNLGGRPRRLSATSYNDWVLGELRHKSAPYVVTEIDARSGAIMARNPYNTGFNGRVAFSDASEPLRTVTCDRGEFIGRNGSLADPAALGRTRLAGRIGAGLDPCAAIQVPIDLAEGQEREVVFILGSAANVTEAQVLAQRFHSPVACQKALDAVHEHWRRVLGTVQVETPEPALDVLANGWLLYQVLSCRFWARTGFYQSGGAFGFRDQLQDTMALVHAEPALAREHILRCAAHQFRDGDVQHWWHPPLERGVRTRFSDDFLWLPLAVSRYIETTGDSAVLTEEVAFLDGRQVRDDEEGYYDLATVGEEKASLYVHCQRAIERGLRLGAHGLPLMGCGDWNDGMNLVGIHGKGESVWLGFFLCDVLKRFAPLARERGDDAFAQQCATHIAKLTTSIEAEAWDGAWYRRAWFDDGTVMGSKTSPECRIDSLPQSWAVLSGIGDPARARTAMAEVDRQLVRRESGLIQLFDPPFDRSALDPGYIKGYLPGVRENGGQYTHAALWTVMAFAQLGDAERAWELFRLINPVLHADTPQRVATYQVEPYVVAADVYGVAPHIGRGGWTWYTGSAGWMYRLAVESLLGLRREGDRLRLTPCLPRDWTGFTLRYRFHDTTYRITVRVGTLAQVRLDGIEQANGIIPLTNDRQDHAADVVIAAGTALRPTA